MERKENGIKELIINLYSQEKYFVLQQLSYLYTLHVQIFKSLSFIFAKNNSNDIYLSSLCLSGALQWKGEKKGKYKEMWQAEVGFSVKQLLPRRFTLYKI